MDLSNYTGLQASVITLSHRTDLSAQMPAFIALAEARFYSDIDSKQQDTKASLVTVAGTETVSLPADFINMRSLAISADPYVVLTYRTPDQFYNERAYTDTGKPYIYTIIGNTLYLRDIPDGVYTLNAIYRAKVPALATNSTNWLLTSFPNIYLAASMVEVARYVKSDEMLQTWEAIYKQGVTAVNNQDWANAATLRTRTDVRS